ncbi:xanthine dehydrogenase/oxidase, partial [Biomphalaria glabrata]
GVIEACTILKNRMAPVKASMVNPTWEQLVQQCYEKGIDLTASYMTSPTDQYASRYNCYSVACVEAELDVLTGQYQLRQMDMLYDAGISMNPELDIGQAEGGFIMGMGYFLQEGMKFDPTTGKALNDGTWEYKIPLAKDLPMNFNFKFIRNAPNPLGVLRSKAVGEPPLTMGAAALLAIKHAVEAARSEVNQDSFFALSAPATPDVVQGYCLNDINNFTFGN